MTFVAPAPEDFLDRFPEFEDLDEGRIQAVLDEIEPLVDETWIDRDRAAGILYYAAHLLFAQEQQAAALNLLTASATGTAVSGPVVRERVGPLQTQYQTGGSTTTSSKGGGGTSPSVLALESSPYGLRYLELLRFSAPAVLVV